MLTPSHYGLTNAEDKIFRDALADSCRVLFNVAIHDRNEDLITSIDPQMIEGSVDVDATRDVTRSLTVSLSDPNHKLAFDARNPAEGALFADNFISVEYGFFVEALNRWVDVPIFFGVLTKFHRDGSVVSVEAQGKEALALDPHFVIRHFNCAKGMTVANAIRRVMDQIGERRYALGMVKGRLHHARGVMPGEQPWRVVVGGDTDGSGENKPSLMAKANGHMYLFYNGRGTLTAKNRNAKPVWSFENDKHVVSDPGYEFDALSFRNHAEVRGGKGKHATRHAHGEFTLAAAHPLSPFSLARNGEGRFLSVFLEADNLKTDAACRAKARKIVEARAFQGVSATFESLPIPMLEEGDVVSLNMGTFALDFKLNQFSIPLTVDGTMSVGFNKRAKLRRRHRRSF